MGWIAGSNIHGARANPLSMEVKGWQPSQNLLHRTGQFGFPNAGYSRREGLERRDAEENAEINCKDPGREKATEEMQVVLNSGAIPVYCGQGGKHGGERENGGGNHRQQGRSRSPGSWRVAACSELERIKGMILETMSG